MAATAALVVAAVAAGKITQQVSAEKWLKILGSIREGSHWKFVGVERDNYAEKFFSKCVFATRSSLVYNSI